MANIPEFERPPDVIVAQIVQHYHENKRTYAKVWEQLRDVRYSYEMSSIHGKRALLKLSYLNAVASVRTQVIEHELVVDKIMAGASLEEAWSHSGPDEKVDYAKVTLANDDLWENLVNLLEDGQVDAAHKLLLDEGKYVGTAKAPFTLANLGFTQKMCIDANVARVLGADDQPDTASLDTYERLCTDVKNLFPELSNELESYELQWLLFDYQRVWRTRMDDAQKKALQRGDVTKEKPVTRHESWFEHATKPIAEIRKQMDRVTPDKRPPERYMPLKYRDEKWK